MCLLFNYVINIQIIIKTINVHHLASNSTQTGKLPPMRAKTKLYICIGNKIFHERNLLFFIDFPPETIYFCRAMKPAFPKVYTNYEINLKSRRVIVKNKLEHFSFLEVHIIRQIAYPYRLLYRILKC